MKKQAKSDFISIQLNMSRENYMILKELAIKYSVSVPNLVKMKVFDSISKASGQLNAEEGGL